MSYSGDKFTNPTMRLGSFARGFLDAWSAIGGVIVLSFFVGIGLALGVVTVYLPYQSISIEMAKTNETVVAKTEMGRIQQNGE